jgi:hypothetical protein
MGIVLVFVAAKMVVDAVDELEGHIEIDASATEDPRKVLPSVGIRPTCVSGNNRNILF